MVFTFSRGDFVTGAAFQETLSSDPEETWELFLFELVDKVARHLSVSPEELLVLAASLDDCPEADSLWTTLEDSDKEPVAKEEHPHGALLLYYYTSDGAHPLTFAVSGDQNADTHVMVAATDFDAFNAYVATLELEEY